MDLFVTSTLTQTIDPISNFVSLAFLALESRCGAKRMNSGTYCTMKPGVFKTEVVYIWPRDGNDDRN